MRVTLITKTEMESVELASKAASTCTNKSKVNDKELYVGKILKRGHTSILEHVQYTFMVEGISRSCSHQLVRHRIGVAFSQESQRYCEAFDGGDIMKDIVVPEKIADSEEAMASFQATVALIKRCYKELIDLGVRKEDARFILPEAYKTNMVVSFNARALSHFFNERLFNKSAQWEIRELAARMYALIEDDFDWKNIP